MRVFYGYGRTAHEAKAAKADRVFLDYTPERYDRADMIRGNNLEPGDTLVLFNLRELGGGPRTDAIWQAKVEAAGATIEYIQQHKPAPEKSGPKPRYAPDAAAYRRHRTIWLDNSQSLKVRRKAISADHGSPVTRSMMNKRFGWPGREKPIPAWAVADLEDGPLELDG